MKKNLNYLLSALGLSAAAIFTLSGCRDYDQFDQEEATIATVGKQYDAAWLEAFGTPDPNHKWGMDEEIGVIGALSSGTRAGQVNTNRNQWTEFDGNSKGTITFPNYGTNTPTVKVPNYRNSALGHDIQIPGWPHLNGLYYKSNGDALDGAIQGDNVTSGMIPAGDVTPYEIQYVSNWFRTHQIRNPKDYRMKLHLTDFFIQNISCDNDQQSYNTGSINPYLPGWEKTGNNGANIETKEQAKLHKAVDGGPYVKDNKLNENIQYNLDHLGFKDMDGTWTHVNNFNSGNSNFDPENKASNPRRMIMYITSAGTEDFHCHPSWCTDTEWIDSWVLVRLTWNETVKDENSPYAIGTVIPREGYYLAFDFHGKKSGQEVYQDGYYSNWIVKITPGYFTSTGNSRRIFCEDLGGTFDFDFNDAVIDVAFEGSGSSYTPIISVQAAGGTMPIYVEKSDAKYELHNLLGYGDNMVPINVKDKSHPVAIYRGGTVSEAKPGKIKIFVNNTKNNTTYKISGDDDDRSIDDKNNSTLDGIYDEDHATKIAPSAFAAPTSVEWPTEMSLIETAYEKFPNWVKDKTKDTDWYKHITANAPLYKASAIIPGTGEFAPPTNGGQSWESSISWTPLTPDDKEESVTAANSVHADSYLRVQGYTGTEQAVFGQLDNLTDEQRMTCTIVLSSSTLYNQDTYTTSGDKVIRTPGTPLQAIIVPADISENKMYYKGAEFTTAVMQRFNSATYVEDNHEFSGEKTYTVEFSFKKSDIVKSTNADGSVVYHDYLLLFLKVGNGSGTDCFDLGTGGHGVTVRKWFVHY